MSCHQRKNCPLASLPSLLVCVFPVLETDVHRLPRYVPYNGLSLHFASAEFLSRWLCVQQWLLSKIGAVEVQQVKGIKDYRAFFRDIPGTQASKARRTFLVKRHNLAVEMAVSALINLGILCRSGNRRVRLLRFFDSNRTVPFRGSISTGSRPTSAQISSQDSRMDFDKRRQHRLKAWRVFH